VRSDSSEADQQTYTPAERCLRGFPLVPEVLLTLPTWLGANRV
jgi:hypothetical protein